MIYLYCKDRAGLLSGGETVKGRVEAGRGKSHEGLRKKQERGRLEKALAMKVGEGARSQGMLEEMGQAVLLQASRGSQPH